MDRTRISRVVAMASIVALPVVAISAAVAAQRQTIPPLLADRDGQTIWVSAERVAAEGSELLRRLDDRQRFPVGWLLEALSGSPASGSILPGSDGCLQIFEPAGGVGNFDFDAQVRTRTTILVGTVVDARDGLARGSPQTMLLVAVDGWLKRPAGLPANTRAYLRYSSARVEIAGVSACRPRGEELPPAPAAGAPVLAMLYGEPTYSDSGDTVFYAGQTLMYDGLQEGQPTLMASDALLKGSPAWLVDATVAELAERTVRLLAAPAEVETPGERSPPVAPPVDRGDQPATGVARQADPADPCLLTEECLVTPLVLAFDVFGAGTTDVNSSSTLFDIDGDERPERTAWLSGDTGDAFLWMDLNHNGAVDGATEFVGAPGTDPRDEPGAIDSSFEILALYDQPRYGGNGDGRIDHRDRVWGQLLSWNDRNDDGVSAPAEIAPVGGTVVYFDVAYELTDEWDGSLNRIIGRGRYWIRGPRRDLRAREVVELALRFR